MKTVIAALLVALPLTALAAPPRPPPPPPGGADAELGALRREIAAIKLDRLLNLSRDQARALLPLVKEAVQLREGEKAEHDKRSGAIARALAMVRDDLKRDGVVSEASRKALKDARGDEQTKDQRKRLREIRKAAGEVLTPDQRKAMRNFDPRPLGGPGEMAGAQPGPGPDERRPGPGPGEGPGPRRGDKNRAFGDGKPGPGKPGHGALMVVLSPEFVTLLETRAK